jgi:hypothetical protein
MRGCVGLALLSLTCTCFADQRVTIDSVSPASGSVAGGTLVTLKTRGVVGDLKDNARVYFGDSRAEVVDFRRDDGALLCFAPPSSIQKKVTITVDATSRISCMGCTFEYSMQLTPYISSVSVTYPPLSTSKDAPMGRLSATHCTPPLEVVSQLRLEMQLAGLNAVPELLVRLHSAGEVDSRLVCTAVQSISEQSLYAIDCELAQVQAGAYNLSLSVPNLGAAQFKRTILRPQLGLATHAMFILLPSLSSIQPQHGSVYGGGVVTIRGSGFSMDAQEVSVSLSGVECDVTHADPTKILCVPQAVSGVKRLRQRPAAGSNSMVGSATGEARLAMNSTQDANSTRAPITQDTNSTRAPITFPPSSANPSSAATVELSPAAQTDTPTQTYIQSATNTPTVTGTFLGDGEEMRGSRGASLLMWRTGKRIALLVATYARIDKFIKKFGQVRRFLRPIHINGRGHLLWSHQMCLSPISRSSCSSMLCLMCHLMGITHSICLELLTLSSRSRTTHPGRTFAHLSNFDPPAKISLLITVVLRCQFGWVKDRCSDCSFECQPSPADHQSELGLCSVALHLHLGRTSRDS